jgi:hypothetical protein
MLDSKAQAVANGLVAHEGIDPMMAAPGPFLQFLMQLLQQLLPMLLGCLGPTPVPPAAALTAAQNLKPLQRWMLRLQIRKALGDQEAISMLAMPLDRQVRAMIAASTADDMTAAIAEVS